MSKKDCKTEKCRMVILDSIVYPYYYELNEKAKNQKSKIHILTFNIFVNLTFKGPSFFSYVQFSNENKI